VELCVFVSLWQDCLGPEQHTIASLLSIQLSQWVSQWVYKGLSGDRAPGWTADSNSIIVSRTSGV